MTNYHNQIMNYVIENIITRSQYKLWQICCYESKFLDDTVEAWKELLNILTDEQTDEVWKYVSSI